jgi:hypothetical protein
MKYDNTMINDEGIGRNYEKNLDAQVADGNTSITEIVTNIKKDLMSLFTDSNMKFIQTEGKKEEFGALMTLGYGFKQIDNYFREKFAV